MDAKQSSGPPLATGIPDKQQDVLIVYYGIHDALRELGDEDADVGETEAPPREAVISGLWDAASALSRLVSNQDSRASE